MTSYWSSAFNKASTCTFLSVGLNLLELKKPRFVKLSTSVQVKTPVFSKTTPGREE